MVLTSASLTTCPRCTRENREPKIAIIKDYGKLVKPGCQSSHFTKGHSWVHLLKFPFFGL